MNGETRRKSLNGLDNNNNNINFTKQKIGKDLVKKVRKKAVNLVKKIMNDEDGKYALHYKRLAQIYINFGEFKNLFLGIGKTREDVENILLAARPLLVTATVDEQPKQPWEDWDDGNLQLSKDGDMVSVKDHVYIRVGNRYEPFNKSTATLYTQDGCLSGSWLLAAKEGDKYKYVSHTEAVKRQMNRQIFYTGQELEDVKQKLKTRYRDAIRMRFVDEFLSNKDRLFKYRCKELFKISGDYNLDNYTDIDPLYNRNLVAEKSNMLRAKEAIVRVEFNCCRDVEDYDQKRERNEDEQKRQRVERKKNKREVKAKALAEAERKKAEAKALTEALAGKKSSKKKKTETKLSNTGKNKKKKIGRGRGRVKREEENEIEFKPTEMMFASDSESEAPKEQKSDVESEAFVEAPKEIELQESDVESEAFVEAPKEIELQESEEESKTVEEESKTVEGESKELEAPKEIELQESEEETKTVEGESQELEAPKEIELQESDAESVAFESKELERVDSPMSDDDLMRLMKDDRVLDMLDGLSDSESVREMSMSESDQEVREVKVSVDSDSDKEFSFAASTSEDDTLTSMMQNMDAFASDEDDEDEVKWASTSSGAD